VAADNLGAHSIGGFVESFSATHVCRFCLAELSEIQVKEVRTGAFKPRTNTDSFRKSHLNRLLWCEKAVCSD
jgi:3-deoxy-D-arabino-heptulosonate 7-phosphate (DAHP) synthase